jgi:hypothetical protein
MSRYSKPLSLFSNLQCRSQNLDYGEPEFDLRYSCDRLFDIAFSGPGTKIAMLTARPQRGDRLWRRRDRQRSARRGSAA